MPFAATKGGQITKSDLDLLAVKSNLWLTPADMGRTYDVQQSGYTPATMTGAFSFSTEIESYYNNDPVNSPVTKAAPRWAWCALVGR